MNIPEKLTRVNKFIWFLLIFTGATMLYLFNIGFSDMWIDESFTHALVKHSFGNITNLIKDDFHPPLYFYGLKIFVSIFGVSVFTIRLFSVLGVLSIIVLEYFVGQRVFGNLQATDSIGKVLKKDEQFCVANFPIMPFNENNFKQILSESQLIKIDTVVDNKVPYGSCLLLYMLKYGGSK